jgi:uncharacterized phage protein (TIGR02218 family)
MTKFVGQAIQAAALNGVFDGARIRVERAFMDTPGHVIGTLVRFEGAVSQVQPTSTTVKLVVASELERLNVKVPYNRFTPTCNHAVFDTGCGLNRATHTYTVAVQPGSTRSAVQIAVSMAEGYFTAGWAQFSAGCPTVALRGLRWVVQAHAGGVLTPAVIFPAAPVPGDGFTIVPGCDRLRGTCLSKFDNVSRFRGFPWVPLPTSTVG